MVSRFVFFVFICMIVEMSICQVANVDVEDEFFENFADHSELIDMGSSSQEIAEKIKKIKVLKMKTIPTFSEVYLAIFRSYNILSRGSDENLTVIQTNMKWNGTLAKVARIEAASVRVGLGGSSHSDYLYYHQCSIIRGFVMKRYFGKLPVSFESDKKVEVIDSYRL